MFRLSREFLDILLAFNPFSSLLRPKLRIRAAFIVLLVTCCNGYEARPR